MTPSGISPLKSFTLTTNMAEERIDSGTGLRGEKWLVDGTLHDDGLIPNVVASQRNFGLVLLDGALKFDGQIGHR